VWGSVVGVVEDGDSDSLGVHALTTVVKRASTKIRHRERTKSHFAVFGIEEKSFTEVRIRMQL
jgi:hypothetical protein